MSLEELCFHKSRKLQERHASKKIDFSQIDEVYNRLVDREKYSNYPVFMKKLKIVCCQSFILLKDVKMVSAAAFPVTSGGIPWFPNRYNYLWCPYT